MDIVIQGICKKCLGCNKLEYTGFQGIYKCDNYRNAEGDEYDNNKNNQIKLEGDDDESF